MSLFDENISRRSFLGGGVKTAALLFAAPALINVDRMMKIWVPGDDKIILDPNEINFTLQGLIPGSAVYVGNSLTGEVYISERVNAHRKGWKLPFDNSLGEPVSIRIRKAGYKSMTIDSMTPAIKGGEIKIVGMPILDQIYAGNV